jgi:antitoxin component YwqK of YwqJK toxin-antitoxin module
VRKIKNDVLHHDEDDVEEVAYYEGKAFTGLAYEGKGGYRYEYMYRDGLEDGKSIGFYPDGNKKFEIEYKAGVEVNGSYEWYATGQTKVYIKYSETSSLSEITRKYAENGVILYEDISKESITKSWYESGELKYLRTEEKTEYYSKSGEVAFTHSGPHPEYEHNRYSNVDWTDHVLSGNCDYMAEDPILANFVWAWVHNMLNENETKNAVILFKMISYSAFAVKSSAINTAGDRKLSQAIPYIESELGNMLKKKDWEGGYLHSIDEMAQKALPEINTD